MELQSRSLPDVSTFLPFFLIEILLYGMHVVLFCICFFILIVRRKTAQRMILLALLVMFGLATADIAVSSRITIHDIPSLISKQIDSQAVLMHAYPKVFLFITNNLLAGLIIIHRCYVVWNRRPSVVFTAFALLVAYTVWGYLAASAQIHTFMLFNSAYFWTMFAFNFVMTMATAGRIWWMKRKVNYILGVHITRRYYIVLAILIESGVIYCISLLLVAFRSNLNNFLISVILRAVAIVPTLMIVQVELGQKYEQPNTEFVTNTTVVPWAISLAPMPPPAAHTPEAENKHHSLAGSIQDV